MDEGVVLLLVGAVLGASVLVALGLGSDRRAGPGRVPGARDAPRLGRAWRHRVRRRRARAPRRRRRARPDPVRGRPADVVAAPARSGGASSAAQHRRSRRDRVAHRSRGSGAVRPHLARGHPARRRGRVHRRRGRVRHPPLHSDPPPSRPHARGRVGRERPDGDRTDDRPDRVDREPGDRRVRRARPARRPSARPRLGRRARSGCGCDLDIRPAASLGRPLRSGRLARCGGRLVRGGRRHRWERVPRRVPRGPRRRQHAVALPSPARGLPRGPRVPRAGRALHRPGPARVPASAHRRRLLRPRAGAAAHAAHPTRRGMGLDGIQRLHGA